MKPTDPRLEMISPSRDVEHPAIVMRRPRKGNHSFCTSDSAQSPRMRLIQGHKKAWVAADRPHRHVTDTVGNTAAARSELCASAEAEPSHRDKQGRSMLTVYSSEVCNQQCWCTRHTLQFDFAGCVPCPQMSHAHSLPCMACAGICQHEHGHSAEPCVQSSDSSNAEEP
jgi:hypothetical protein